MEREKGVARGERGKGLMTFSPRSRIAVRFARNLSVYYMGEELGNYVHQNMGEELGNYVHQNIQLTPSIFTRQSHPIITRTPRSSFGTDGQSNIIIGTDRHTVHTDPPVEFRDRQTHTERERESNIIWGRS